MLTLIWKELSPNVKDTSNIQLESLIRFGRSQGAIFRTDGSFYKRGYKIRFNTMVKWHNASGDIENRIVKNVKLQRQKDGEILVQNHLVKFLKPVYKIVFFDQQFSFRL